MKIALIKFSGKTLNDFLTTEQWVDTINYLNKKYDGIVLVHGAGSNISDWAKLLGIESKFVDGQRVTSSELMDVVAAVQAGVVNSKIVAKLTSCQIDANGYSGIDRNLFVADYLNEQLGFVGLPKLIGNTGWIKELLLDRIVPVFSSVCRDSNGNLMNVNADVFAENLAAALNADSVYFVSDVDGVKLKGETKDYLTSDEIEEGIAQGEITDGMIPKLRSCAMLLNHGINKIWIGSKITGNNKNSHVSSNTGTWIVNKHQLIKLTNVA